MIKDSKKIFVSITTSLLILLSTPKQTKAGVIEGALIGAGIGAVVGIVMTFFKKKPSNVDESKNTAPKKKSENSKSDSLEAQPTSNFK